MWATIKMKQALKASVEKQTLKTKPPQNYAFTQI
jgi:hypothetical protein